MELTVFRTILERNPVSSFLATHSRSSIELRRIVTERQTAAPDLDVDDDDAGRLPRHIALPLILLASLASWAIILLAVLWLRRWLAIEVI